MISARTARSQHLAVGDVVKPLPVANVVRIPLTIVGVIEPAAVHGSFWEPWNLFNATPAIFDNQLPRIDSFFVSHHALASRTNTVAQTVAADVRPHARRRPPGRPAGPARARPPPDRRGGRPAAASR